MSLNALTNYFVSGSEPCTCPVSSQAQFFQFPVLLSKSAPLYTQSLSRYYDKSFASAPKLYSSLRKNKTSKTPSTPVGGGQFQLGQLQPGGGRVQLVAEQNPMLQVVQLQDVALGGSLLTSAPSPTYSDISQTGTSFDILNTAPNGSINFDFGASSSTSVTALSISKTGVNCNVPFNFDNGSVIQTGSYTFQASATQTFLFDLGYLPQVPDTINLYNFGQGFDYTLSFEGGSSSFLYQDYTTPLTVTNAMIGSDSVLRAQTQFLNAINTVTANNKILAWGTGFAVPMRIVITGNFGSLTTAGQVEVGQNVMAYSTNQPINIAGNTLAITMQQFPLTINNPVVNNIYPLPTIKTNCRLQMTVSLNIPLTKVGTMILTITPRNGSNTKGTLALTQPVALV